MADQIRWLDGGKASLRLKLQLVSSLYTQDHALGEFFAYSVPPASPDGKPPLFLKTCIASSVPLLYYRWRAC